METQVTATLAEEVGTAHRPPGNPRFRWWLSFVALLTLLFVKPLWALFHYAAGRDLYSHIILVPFLAGYLLYIRRGGLPAPYRASIPGTFVLGVVGAAAAAGALLLQGTSSLDRLALATLAYITFLGAGTFLCLGAAWMRAAVFPFAFLVFMVPLPEEAVQWLEKGSALASAEVAAVFFSVTGTPFVRHGAVFELPGIVIEVARECSGIRSSLVLFITSVLATHLLLTRPLQRIVLVAFVIPLGILRNGFRILVIGLLCVNVGPHMIDSPIHRQGGPFFFVLSLVPLFWLLWLLRRSESRDPVRR